jgi:hypothetical protein
MSKRPKKNVKKTGKRKQALKKTRAKKVVKRPIKKRLYKVVKKTKKNRVKTKRPRRPTKHSVSVKRIKDADLKRGDYKSIEIILPGRSIKGKSDYIKNADIPELKYLYERNVQPDETIKYPRNIMVSFRVQAADKSGFVWVSFLPPLSFVTTPSNVKNYIAKLLKDEQFIYGEAEKSGEPTEYANVDRVAIRYLY